MSDSNDDFPNDDSPAQKRRKMQRACDVCRRKKIKCDGGDATKGKKCANCLAYGFDCTYADGTKKRRFAKGYVEALEQRLTKAEDLLSKVMGTSELSQALEGEHTTEAADVSWIKFKRASPAPVKLVSAIARSFPHRQPQEADNTSDEEDAVIHAKVTEGMRRLELDPSEIRFVGRSSGIGLLHRTMMLRDHQQNNPYSLDHRRMEFWTNSEWETVDDDPEPGVQYDFPEPDLMDALINLYFEQMNIFIPLLHRPTFQKSIDEGLHYKHKVFAATVLCVCAIGARFSHDPRVYLENVTHRRKSAGWKWFTQVRRFQVLLLDSVSVYDLQKCALAAIYMQGCSMPHACWTTVGTGIRMAQDAGIHRKGMFGSGAQTKAEQEIWKRAFWCLVCLDRALSLGMGRPCSIHDEDIDADYPIACDDEYWYTDDPKDAFVQPPGKPSVMEYFNATLDLNEILAFCSRTLYSINKSRSMLGIVDIEWKKHIVTELDSALNKWIDSIPEHIRWDPHRENDIFFSQSALLHCWYYQVQILTHRPFITSDKKSEFPSLAICTNAARATSHIADCQLRRPSRSSLHQCAHPIFSAAVVLLLNIWSGKRSGLTLNPRNEMGDVYKCMKSLRSLEQNWHYAGRLWDILYELSCAGELPLPPPSNKRGLDSESPKTDISSASSPYPESPDAYPTSASTPIYAPHLPVVPSDPLSNMHTPYQSSFSTNDNTNTWPSPQSVFMQSPMSAGPSYLPANQYPQFGGGDMYTDMQGQGQGQGQQAMLLDTEAFGMWPTGFELEDWGQYLSSLTNGPT